MRTVASQLFGLWYTEAMVEFEKKYITEHLKRNEYDLVKTARAVGITKDRLDKRMSALGFGQTNKNKLW